MTQRHSEVHEYTYIYIRIIVPWKILQHLTSFPGRFVGGRKKGLVSIVCACVKYSVYSAYIF